MADIAINPVTRRVQFTGNTGTGPFAFTFNILADEDIAVYKNTTLLTLTTHYSVTTNANGTGSITLVAGQALISSDVLTIIGGRDLSRTTDFVTAGDLLASSLNEQLDSLVIMTQQLDEKVGRTIKTNPGDVYTDLELPTKDNRKGTVLGFNATSGDPEVGPTIADVSSLASITADIATLADIEDGTDATDAIQTVAGISSNVTTVAGISANVTTVAGNTSNINAVAADATDIGTVAGSISNVNTVAGIDSNITTVAGNTTNINTVAGNNSNITTVAGVSANVTTVAGISSDVTTVAGISSDVTTVAADGTDIGTVATNIADVNTVASNIATISAKVSKSGDTMTGDLTIQGNLTVSGTTITVDSATAQTIDLGDGDKMRFGDSNDAYIEWNGTYFDLRSTGRFDLLSSGNDLRLSTATNVGLIVNHTGGTPAVQLYNSGVERLATTSTGVDITGTITSDGLTVDGTVVFDSSAASANIVRIDGAVNQNTRLVFRENGTDKWNIGSDAAADFFNIYDSVNSSNRLTVENSGDISFYEDTGTTAKFFWDASAESLGIGTSSPDNKITIGDSSSIVVGKQWGLDFQDTLKGEPQAFIYAEGRYSANYNTDLIFGTIGTSGSATERLRIDSSGQVGIGTSSPSRQLHLASSVPAIRLEDTDVSGAYNEIVHLSNGELSFRVDHGNVQSSSALSFSIDAAERMRIDSSGNLLVANTTGASADTGHIFAPTGIAFHVRDGGIPLVVDRLTDDGDLQLFRKDGTTVGSISSSDSGQTLNLEGGGTSGVRINASNASGYIRFRTAGSERMRIDSSGNVGIGTTTVGQIFTTDVGLTVDSGNAYSGIHFTDGATSGALAQGYSTTYLYNRANGSMLFGTNDTERMRIDNSGNLLVGTTDALPATNNDASGIALRSDGNLMTSRSGAVTARFNRGSTDGPIVEFHKDGTTVGSIGSTGTANEVYIANSDSVGLKFTNVDAIVPSTHTGGGANRDAAIDLGYPTVRFKDLYLSGGVYLGGVGAANRLTNYEEGTWTPVFTGWSTTGTTSVDGSYTKIGNTVIVTGRFRSVTGSIASTKGTSTITGLPFSISGFTAFSVSVGQGGSGGDGVGANNGDTLYAPTISAVFEDIYFQATYHTT